MDQKTISKEIIRELREIYIKLEKQEQALTKAMSHIQNIRSTLKRIERLIQSQKP